MIAEVKRRTGWKIIDEIEIEGDQRQRDCKAISSNHSYHFQIEFDSQGKIRIFQDRFADV
jgi:hypothetical protein